MKDIQQNIHQNIHPSRPAFLLRTKSLREILSDLRKAELWLMMAACAAFLASAFFVVKYFVGGEMQPDLWTGEQWMNALLGLGITAVITAAQAFLYASGYKGHAALIATFIVVFFGVFSEVSQSMEREDATVRHRSENSAVFKATLGSISNLAAAPVLSSAAASELVRARQKAKEIQTRIDNKNRCQSCETTTFRELRTMLATASGRVAAAQARADMEMKAMTSSNAAALQSAISSAKQLEYDEDKHYAMIRLLKSLFGVTGIWASFLFSIIIIGTFEYAFHFVGAYVADHKRALLMLGRDSYGRRLDHDNPIAMEAQLQTGNDINSKTSAHDPAIQRGAAETEMQTMVEKEGDNERVDKTATGAQDFTRKRFYKLIYTEVRNLILNGDIKPTVRPVMDAVTTIIKHKGHILGVKPALIGKPQRQQIAQAILEHLEQEAIVARNQEGGVGKAKYVLAQQYVAAIKQKRREEKAPKQAQLV